MSIFKQVPPYETKAYKRRIDVTLTDHETGRVMVKTVRVERGDIDNFRDFVRVEIVEAVEALFRKMYDG